MSNGFPQEEHLKLSKSCVVLPHIEHLISYFMPLPACFLELNRCLCWFAVLELSFKAMAKRFSGMEETGFYDGLSIG